MPREYNTIKSFKKTTHRAKTEPHNACVRGERQCVQLETFGSAGR